VIWLSPLKPVELYVKAEPYALKPSYQRVPAPCT